MKSYLLILSSAAFLAACSESEVPRRYQADNSQVNERDRHNRTILPTDQSEVEMDRVITQKIRQALTAADHLSMNAKNVKIITANGEVTLRGPVDSRVERDFIVTQAKSIPGVKKINNEIELAH